MLEQNCCAQVGQLAGCTHEGRAAARIQRREAVTDDAGPWASALRCTEPVNTGGQCTAKGHNVQVHCAATLDRTLSCLACSFITACSTFTLQYETNTHFPGFLSKTCDI